MGTRISARLSLLAPLAFFLAFMCTPAQAEMYVAGQVGATIPNSFSNGEVIGPGVPGGTRLSDLDLHNSMMYGAKLGYY